MASRAPVFRVQPGDAPADIAARRLGLTMERFVEVLPRLLARGFPPADPDTGNFDLEAIDVWRRSRHMHLTGAGEMTARDAGQVARDRIAALRKGAA
jgi:hypothetical protein